MATPLQKSIIMPRFYTKKLVVLGDAGVGKRCLVYTYLRERFPHEFTPVVQDGQEADIEVDGKCCELTICCVPCQEDFARLRLLSYPDTDVFLICFALNDLTSLHNVEEKVCSLLKPEKV